MQKSENKPISDCCNSLMRTEGIGDFKDSDRPVTFHFVCNKCNQPCDMKVNKQMIRKGQDIFNFLEWLHTRKGLGGLESYRLADPFYLSDEDWDKYYMEYKKELQK